MTWFAGRGTRGPPIIAAMAGACTPVTVWGMNPRPLHATGSEPFPAERDPTPQFQPAGTVCAASRVAEKRTSGERSWASCRFTRVGAR